jgi:hypothetical protein
VAPDLDLAVSIVLRGLEAIVHTAATERLSDLKSGTLTEATRMLVSLTGKATSAKPGRNRSMGPEPRSNPKQRRSSEGCELYD